MVKDVGDGVAAKQKKKIHKCLKRGSIFLRVHLSGPYNPSLRPILFLMDYYFFLVCLFTFHFFHVDGKRVVCKKRRRR